MTTKHTPTQFKISNDINDIVVRDELNTPLFAVPDNSMRHFIVTAVNSHEDLVKALIDTQIVLVATYNKRLRRDEVIRGTIERNYEILRKAGYL